MQILVIGGTLFIGREIVQRLSACWAFTPTSLEKARAAGVAWYETQPRRPVDYTFEDRLLATNAT